MAFFAHRMLHLSPEGHYGDLLELELYNGALSGMQLDGKRFFYVNPLQVDPAVSGRVPGYQHVLPERPMWHSCACCPPNLARLIASLGRYLWSEDEETVYSHLFIGSEAQTRFGGIRLETEYPWNGKAAYTVEADAAFALAIRIPGYLQGCSFAVNGETITPEMRSGYAYIRRSWQAGDRVELRFELPVRRIHAHPRVKDAAGKAALARGPLIYCAEEADNGACLSALMLTCGEAQALPCDETLLGGIVPLEASGLREPDMETLYQSGRPKPEPCAIRAIPYYAWGNRGKGEMTVWIREN